MSHVLETWLTTKKTTYLVNGLQYKLISLQYRHVALLSSNTWYYTLILNGNYFQHNSKKLSNLSNLKTTYLPYDPKKLPLKSIDKKSVK